MIIDDFITEFRIHCSPLPPPSPLPPSFPEVIADHPRPSGIIISINGKNIYLYKSVNIAFYVLTFY